MHSGPTIVMEPIRATWRQPMGMTRVRPGLRAGPGTSSSVAGTPAANPAMGPATLSWSAASASASTASPSSALNGQARGRK